MVLPDPAIGHLEYETHRSMLRHSAQGHDPMTARIGLSLSALSYALALPLLLLLYPDWIGRAEFTPVPVRLYLSWQLLTLMGLGGYALVLIWWQRALRRAHGVNLLAISGFFIAAALNAARGGALTLSTAHGISEFGFQLALLILGLVATLVARSLLQPRAATPWPTSNTALVGPTASTYRSPERWLPADST